MPPTREEWKQMVVDIGYAAAVDKVGCDLDDIPGIEETWLENWDKRKDAFEQDERKFLLWLKRNRERTSP